MCGIAGIFSINNAVLDVNNNIKKMVDSIAHRGPDDEGFYQDKDIALGFRRLSIIDLKTGNQPIHNEDKKIWTIFNGEIYNYKEIRALLEKKHTFYTNTDTEVLVHLYEDAEDEMVHHLRGMFAFCIWDSRKRNLIICRDRLGIKPLFYAETKEFFLFASEIKAILASGLVDRSMDIEALNHYLGLQYIPAPMTIFKQIKKLPPAHILSLTKKDTVKIKEYWDTRNIPINTLSFDDCKDKMNELLHESVRLRLRSDVPIGAFLSGGVDSSAVVAIMAKLNNSAINTFTICHRDKAYDESAYAKCVSDRYGTNHQTLVIGPEDFLSLMPSALEQFDEPFADSSALPTYLVSKFARESVKVVLSGDGGDEILAGYARYARELQFSRIEKTLRLKAVVPEALKRTLHNQMSFTHSFFNRVNKFIVNILSTEVERHLFFMSYFRSHKYNLYSPILRDRFCGNEDTSFFNTYFKKANGNSLLRKILYLDQKTYLPNDILYKVDIASMANSLEVRVPLLDHKLVEFVSSIPDEYKLTGNNGKMIFKNLLEDLLPQHILYRKKIGFEIPVSSWFRKELAKYIRELLNDSELLSSSYFNRQYIIRMIDDHQSGIQDFGPQLWILMVLVIWHQKFNGSLVN